MKKHPIAARLCAVALAVVCVAGLAACGQSGSSSDGDKTIKVGASPTPHAQILDAVKDELAKDGYTLEVVEYNDYIQPNTALEDGQLDANYFQHITYMNNFNEDSGTHLVSVAGLHYEPFGIYAGKTASLDALADGAVVAIPNDPTNGGRALLLLQEQNLIQLKEGSGLEPTVSDIVENPKNLSIKELEAKLLTTTLQDVDVAVINGNYAIGAGLKFSEALAVESPDGTAGTAYVNVLAVKEGREKDEAILKLVEVLKSSEVRQFIEEKYEGGVVPVD